MIARFCWWYQNFVGRPGCVRGRCPAVARGGHPVHVRNCPFPGRWGGRSVAWGYPGAGRARGVGSPGRPAGSRGDGRPGAARSGGRAGLRPRTAGGVAVSAPSVGLDEAPAVPCLSDLPVQHYAYRERQRIRREEGVRLRIPDRYRPMHVSVPTARAPPDGAGRQGRQTTPTRSESKTFWAPAGALRTNRPRP
jgi:hypothetical protein